MVTASSACRTPSASRTATCSAGLRRPAVVGGDHDQRRGHRADPGQHVADEPLVPGHVDEREPPARRQRRPGEAEVDGEPAPALLRPPVGLHAGERAHQRGLAVVDVAAVATTSTPVAHRPGHLQHGGGERVVVGRVDAAQVQQAAVGVDVADDRRAARPQRLGERAGQRHRGAGQRVLRRPAPADRAPRSPPRRRRARRRPAAPPARRRGARSPAGSAASSRATGRRGPAQRRLQRGQRRLVDPQRPVERVPAQPLHQLGRGRAPARPAGRRAACRRWPAPGPRRRRACVCRSGSSGSAGAARSSPEPMSATSGTPVPASARPARRTGTDAVNPRTTKFDGCTLSTAPVCGPSAAAVVRRASPGWSCRPRAAGRRCDSSSSGMRKPSPISTSSPRASTSSRPGPSAVATSASAAAQLLTTSAASAAGHGGEQRGDRRLARAARAGRWPGRARRRWCRRRRRTASTAAGDSGARPRLVCTSDAGGVEHRRRRLAAESAAPRRTASTALAGRHLAVPDRAAAPAWTAAFTSPRPEPLRRGGQPRVGEQRVGARHAAGAGRSCLHRTQRRRGGRLAEADGNRTRLTEMLGHVGFRGRGGHQTP